MLLRTEEESYIRLKRTTTTLKRKPLEIRHRIYWRGLLGTEISKIHSSGAEVGDKYALNYIEVMPTITFIAMLLNYRGGERERERVGGI